MNDIVKYHVEVSCLFYLSKDTPIHTKVMFTRSTIFIFYIFTKHKRFLIFSKLFSIFENHLNSLTAINFSIKWCRSERNSIASLNNFGTCGNLTYINIRKSLGKSMLSQQVPRQARCSAVVWLRVWHWSVVPHRDVIQAAAAVAAKCTSSWLPDTDICRGSLPPDHRPSLHTLKHQLSGWKKS